MQISSRQLVYIGLVVGVAILAYAARGVIGPFILAALFAYLLNPLVNFLSGRIRLPRSLSISLIYVVLIGSLTIAVLNIGNRISEESADFSTETHAFINDVSASISTLPNWFQPVARDGLDSVRTSLMLPRSRIVTFLPGAINRTISTLVFLVAGFYFLRDGNLFVKELLGYLPKKAKRELDLVLEKIFKVLGNYLRGQLLLVAIMSTVTYIGLTIIGVRYALILSVFTGLAEIIPYVGPVVAAAIAMAVGFADNYSRVGGSPVFDALVIAALYTVLRQLEDLFIIPQVMGRLTKLHPLIIMLAVLTGGHLFGIVGYLVAVPLVASFKVVLEHFLPLIDSSHQ